MLFFFDFVCGYAGASQGRPAFSSKRAGNVKDFATTGQAARARF